MEYCEVVNTDTPNTLTVKLTGKIDGNNNEDIQLEACELLNGIGDDVESFVFDVNDVTYVSSAGLRTFSALSKECKNRGIAYSLVGLRKDIVRMFQLTGYANIFKIVEKQEV
jgi:anti-anti-sigma factor